MLPILQFALWMRLPVFFLTHCRFIVIGHSVSKQFSDVLQNFVERAPQWLLLLKWWGIINAMILCCSVSFLWMCCERKGEYKKKKRGHVNASSNSSIALDMKISELMKKEKRSRKEKRLHDSRDSDSDEAKEEKKKSKHK
uniref:Uncharacterized protein n=1 Tax=Parascaris univalens TaxID=6257 RepID=A0A915BRT1_PARUN